MIGHSRNVHCPCGRGRTSKHLWLLDSWLEHFLTKILLHYHYDEFTDELTNAHWRRRSRQGRDGLGLAATAHAGATHRLQGRIRRDTVPRFLSPNPRYPPPSPHPPFPHPRP